LRCIREPLKIRNPLAANLSRAYIYGTAHEDTPLNAPLKVAAERARAGGWQYFELATGHEPELDMPRELADVLLGLA